jgi:hypothetical protein
MVATPKVVHAAPVTQGEPPLPAADLHAVAAPFATRLLPNPPIAHAPSTRRRRIAKGRRGLGLSGREDLNLRPFGPESAKLSYQSDGIVYNPRQRLESEGGDQSSDSQDSGGFPKDFSTRLQLEIGRHLHLFRDGVTDGSSHHGVDQGFPCPEITIHGHHRPSSPALSRRRARIDSKKLDAVRRSLRRSAWAAPSPPSGALA